MAGYRNRFGPHNPDATYVAHAFPEQLADLGEVQMNHVVVGDPPKPALLLIPGQTESWWGYEQALPLLAEHFQAYAVDLRGQGRSTRTPVATRSTTWATTSSASSTTSSAARRSSAGCPPAACSPPGCPRTPSPARSSPPTTRTRRSTPPRSNRPSARGSARASARCSELWSTYLGDQWSIGDWDGAVAAAPDVLPAWIAGVLPDARRAAADPERVRPRVGPGVLDRDASPRRATTTGCCATSRCPCCSPTTSATSTTTTGLLMGASSDTQAARVRELLAEAGVAVDYRSFDTMGHSMHGQDPQLFVDTLVDWVATLPS